MMTKAKVLVGLYDMQSINVVLWIIACQDGPQRDKVRQIEMLKKNLWDKGIG